MTIHPEVEKMIAAGKIESAPYADGQVDIETDEEFARRIAALQQEIDAKIADDMGYGMGEGPSRARSIAARIRRGGAV